MAAADERDLVIRNTGNLRNGELVAVESDQLSGNYIKGTVNQFGGDWYLRTGADGPDMAPSGNWIQIDASELQFFVESQGGVQSTSTFTPVGGDANINLALRPKGTGSILADEPDNTATGGNARGTNAVDLQMTRNGADQVASGDNSVLLGGCENTASGLGSTVAGGTGNSAQGENSSISGGINNTASTQCSSIGGGDGNTTTGNFSTIAGGNGNIAAGQLSFIGGGVGNSTTADSATVGGGGNNVASGPSSVISGGVDNQAMSPGSGVGCGLGNMAGGQSSFTAGMQCITSSDFSIAMGNRNQDGMFSGSERIFMIGDPSNTAPAQGNLFSVTADGNANALGACTSGGADFAEWMESSLSSKIPPGTSVKIDAGKIRPANPGEVPFAVISTSPGVIGNTAENHWHGKYLRGEMEEITYEEEVPKTQEVTYVTTKYDKQIINGKVAYRELQVSQTRTEQVFQEFEVFNSDGKLLRTIREPVMVKTLKTRKQKKLNPKFNPNLPYVPRSQRPEWNLGGFLGQIPVRKGQPLNPKWQFLKEIDNEFDLMFITQ